MSIVDAPSRLIFQLLHAADEYVDYDVSVNGKDLGGDFDCEMNFRRIFEQFYNSRIGQAEEWDIVRRQHRAFCKLYISAEKLINAMENRAMSLSCAGIVALIPKIHNNFRYINYELPLLSREDGLKSLIARLFATLYASYSNAPDSSTTGTSATSSFEAPPQSPSRSLYVPSSGLVELRSPRVGISKDKDDVNGQSASQWYSALDRKICNTRPTSSSLLRVAIILSTLAILTGVYIWSIGLTLSSILSHQAEGGPKLARHLPDETDVGSEIAGELAAYALCMQSVVELFEETEASTYRTAANLVARTQIFVYTLDRSASPPWYTQYIIFSKLLSKLCLETPSVRQAYESISEYDTEISAILNQYRSTTTKVEVLKHSLDQLELHLHRIQTTILDHSRKKQFSRLLQVITHLHPSFESINPNNDDIPLDVAVLEASNRKYQKLGNGVVLMLHKKIEEFGEFSKIVLGDYGKTPPKLAELRSKNAAMRMALNDATKLKKSLGSEANMPGGKLDRADGATFVSVA